MTLEKALKSGEKVRIDFINDTKKRRFYLVFDKYTELARMLNNFIVNGLCEYNYEGIAYQATLFVYEEEEVCSGIAEA